MQRKKTPLFSLSPLEMHSPWKMKFPYCPTVCRAPGPFLTLSQPSGVTVYCETYFPPSNVRQPLRSLPLKIGASPAGLYLMFRRRIGSPGVTEIVSTAGCEGRPALYSLYEPGRLSGDGFWLTSTTSTLGS